MAVFKHDKSQITDDLQIMYVALQQVMGEIVDSRCPAPSKELIHNHHRFLRTFADFGYEEVMELWDETDEIPFNYNLPDDSFNEERLKLLGQILVDTPKEEFPKWFQNSKKHNEK